MSNVSHTSFKLKVLNIAELFPPGYAGGAALYVHDTCQFLAERGHDIRVLCTEANDTPSYTIREEIVGNVKVYRLNLPYFRKEDPGGWMLDIAKWREHQAKIRQIADELLSDWQPDLVNFHTPYSLIEECLPSFLKRNIPVVGMTHDFWTICMQASLFRSPIDKLCSGPAPLKCLECIYSYWDGTHLKALAKLPWRLIKLGFYPAYRLQSRANLRHHIDGLICYSQFMTQVHQGHIRGPVKHISLGIDLTDLPVSSKTERPLQAPLRFGFLAGFLAHKGIWDVLDAAASLKKKGFKFELHIWGPGQSEQPLIDRNIQDCVKLRGVFEAQEIWNVYAEIDVLVMATQMAESYGRVIQEAAAAKVPVIAPRIGGITEQIRDGIDGLLFNFRDRQDLERRMIKVLETPELLKNLIANLWQVINTKDAVQEMEKFYELILKERRKTL